MKHIALFLALLSGAAQADYCQFIHGDGGSAYACKPETLLARRPDSITFVYNGDWDGESGTRRYSYHYTYGPVPVTAQVDVWNGDGGYIYSGTVTVGHLFTVEGIDASERLEIFVRDTNGSYAQWITFDPLRPRVGDEVGVLGVWGAGTGASQ